MTAELRSKLQPVQRRQLLQAMTTWMISGLLCGAAVALGCAIARLSLNWLDGGWMAGLALFVGPLLAGLFAIVWHLPRPNWIAAAQAVDLHYGLKDRTESALDFAGRKIPADKQGFAELQLADAMQHLSHVDADIVAPLKAPRLLPGALVATAAAVIFSLLPLKQEEASAGAAAPDEQIVAEAQAMEESIKELEDEFKKDSDPELEQLLKELKQKAEELKEPGVDVKEALAKISEMQAAIQSAQSQSSLEQVDQQLQEIGEAMASAKALEGAGQALAEGKYDKAMKELAELSDLEFDRNEARTTVEKLKKAAKRSGNGADGAISEAAKDIAEGIEDDDDDKAMNGARRLGDKVGKQARKKKINDLLNAELSELSDRKCNCQKNSTAKGKKKQKSNSSSETWGMTESGNIDGDPTSLNSSANREQVTGIGGDGDSDFETSSSSEGRQEAQRGYKEVYQKYKKMSEAVLENEQIPLGHRQTIRRYFESIRPQQGEEAPAKTE